MARIIRGFVDSGGYQVHFRRTGENGQGTPLVLIHPSPGSSRQLEGLMGALATRGVACLAPDTAGNGDSEPLAMPRPEIRDLADHAFAALDALIPGPFDLYGSHTGASIAMEIAIAQPQRVRRLVIEGMGLYAADLQSDILEHYAREIRPDLEATHLMKVWHFCRDQFLFWPYYNRTAAGRLPDGLPDAESLHDFTVEVLKAMRSYHLSYRAAFRHPKRERLPLLSVPTLAICSPSDMLYSFHEEVADLIPGASRATLPAWSDPDFHTVTAEAIAGFLNAEEDQT
ncbi:MAG: alpha/beta hydrolase [Rhodobacteraceae bacterium]|nr:alpha/beta hydrolase [Paracoccaceae bacterium]